MLKHIAHWILVCCLPAFLDAQPYRLLNWSLEEGLPQSQTFALCEDRLGYLWIGTQGGGLCRFDGSDFQVYTTADGLPSNFVNALTLDSAGTLWVGASLGLCRFNGTNFEAVEQSLGQAVNALTSVDPDRLLAGTSQGLFQYELDSRKYAPQLVHNRPEALPVYAFAASGAGDCLIGTHRGLFRYRNGQVSFLNDAWHIPGGPVHAIATNGAKVLVSVLSTGLVLADTAGKQSVFKLPEPNLSRTLCLLADADGTWWAGTQTAGLYHLNPAADSVIELLDESNGLPHNHVRALCRDHNGQLWMGTSGGGFARIGNLAFRQYNRRDGLPGTRIYALCEDNKGNVWCSASQNGLAVIDASGVRQVSPDSGLLQNVKTRTMCFDRQGRLWAGTEGKGVVVVDTAAFTVYNTLNGGLPSDFVQKIVCDAKGRIWVATTGGLVTFAPSTDGRMASKWFLPRDGMPSKYISALQTDREGRLWFGSNEGRVGVIHEGKLTAKYGPETGLPAAMITALAFDDENRCWAATKGRGIFWKNNDANGTFQPIGSTLTSEIIYLLAFDRKGRLWAGAESGVDCIELEGVQARKVNHYGRSEGFSGIETCQDAVLCDRTGRMWFGTMNGLMRYMPNATNRPTGSPVLHFEQISLFYKPLQETRFAASMPDMLDGAGLLLPWNENHLSFAFRAVDLLHSAGLRYRWKLEGADSDWSPWSEQRQVNYAHLAPGRYRFWVQAVNDENLTSEQLSAAFSIATPFWKEWPFLAGISAGLLLLGTLFFSATVRKIRRTEAERREKLEVQNRLLQLEQKALQLQMNPHFLFNALNSVQSLIATRDYDVARQQINEFAKLMRSILNNSRKQTLTLREEIDTLTQYLQIERFCQQNPFTFAVETAPDVDPEALQLPPMLLQPFVENAVVHGVSHLSYPGCISIQFSLQGELLRCVIRDNGIGREKAALLREARKSGHQSTAMSVTRQRLDAMGGSMSVRDLKLPDGALAGTEVEVLIPVTYTF